MRLTKDRHVWFAALANSVQGAGSRTGKRTPIAPVGRHLRVPRAVIVILGTSLIFHHEEYNEDK